MARLTLDDLLAKCSPSVRKLNAGLFPAGGPAPAAKLEPRQPNELEKPAPPKVRDSRKRFVRVVAYLCKLQDEDNLCEKYHVDALRYAGILPSDAPGQCRIVTTQEKVRSKAEERTEISVEIILD